MRKRALPAIERHGAIRAWIIDDTGFPKKGTHSVGVARQYCGQLGKQDNCQVAVSLSVANDHASLPIAYRLYLPQAWADDQDRRRGAGVPDDVRFQTKPQIALEQIEAAMRSGVSPAAVLMDAGYGVDTNLRDGITDLGLCYVAGIQSSTSVWAPGTAPKPPKRWSGNGCPPKLIRRDAPDTPCTGSGRRSWIGWPRFIRSVCWRLNGRSTTRSANQVQRAYLRTDFLDLRRELAELWGAHLMGESILSKASALVSEQI